MTSVVSHSVYTQDQDAFFTGVRNLSQNKQLPIVAVIHVDLRLNITSTASAAVISGWKAVGRMAEEFLFAFREDSSCWCCGLSLRLILGSLFLQDIEKKKFQQVL